MEYINEFLLNETMTCNFLFNLKIIHITNLQIVFWTIRIVFFGIVSSKVGHLPGIVEFS